MVGVLRFASDGDRAVLVGHLLHSPVQILQAAHNGCFCLHGEQTAAGRHWILGRFVLGAWAAYGAW
ncbi:hypothetical protein ACWET9_39550 [Streptomyces sp. NPDC004059]